MSKTSAAVAGADDTGVVKADDTAFDIALVGLGPVGGAAAIMFADAGLRVVAFEQDPEVYALPRAVMLDGEIVRAFQRIGRAAQVVPLLQHVRPGDRMGFCNSRREWLFGREAKPMGRNGWQPASMFDQPELEGWLRTTAVTHPNVTAHIGATVTGFEQDSAGVTIAATTPDGEVAARAHYLVGCDGASSFVRRQLDIGWHDLGYDHDWLVVDVIVDEGHTLDQDTVQVCDPDRLATYICTKDPYRRWEFKLLDGETRDEMLEPDRIRSLIDPWTPRDTYELRRAAVYRFHAATADTWRVGRVFLAGDAAHQTPPFIGQGLNAGMRDVVNLSWKFPLVFGGVAGEELLDTYQHERNAHALDLVDWAVSVGKLMEHLADVEAAERAGEPVPPTPERLQSSGYGQGRDAPPLRGGVIRLDQVSDTGSTGYLFSQPVVEAGDMELRLDDLLGPGFAIVAHTRAELEVAPRSGAVIERLGIRLVSLDDVREVEGRFDQVCDHAAAVIVRPDRYVFGHTSDTVTLDDLIADLADKLSLTS